MENKSEQINVRLELKLQKELQKIADIESKKTGYNITKSGLIRKIISDFVKNYKE